MPRERTAGTYGDETAGLEPLAGRWLTIHEACAFLGVDQSTLRRWSDTGKVPVFRTPGGHRRYAEADLRALVGGGPRLQERPRVSRQTLTDRSLSGYEDDYLRVARERPGFAPTARNSGGAPASWPAARRPGDAIRIGPDGCW